MNTIAIPAAFAAAMTSASRIEPPGWITAVAPASTAANSPSAKGKKASEATAEPTVRGQFVRDVQGADLDEEERRRVLLVGLRALEGQAALDPQG